MITQLASLFRISLSRGKTVISVEDELKHARNYMNIQKVRYKNIFEVRFDIDPEILQCCTVKLVVQPLLENAIYYGVECMETEKLMSMDIAGKMISILRSEITDLEYRKMKWNSF